MGALPDKFGSQPYRIAERIAEALVEGTDLGADKIRIQPALIVPDAGATIIVMWGDFSADGVAGNFSDTATWMSEVFTVAIVVNDRENQTSKTSAIQMISNLRAQIQDTLLRNQVEDLREVLLGTDGIQTRNIRIEGGTPIKEEIPQGEKVIGQTLSLRIEYIEDWRAEQRELNRANFKSTTETEDGTTREDEWPVTL